MPATLLLASVYLTAEKPITVEVVEMENPAGPSEPATAMHMQGKISCTWWWQELMNGKSAYEWWTAHKLLMITMHYLMLTTNKLKPYGNSNVGVNLSAIIKDIRSSYPELVVESVVSQKSFAVVRQSDMNTICSTGPI